MKKMTVSIIICIIILSLVGCKTSKQESKTPNTHPQLTGKPVVQVSFRKAGQDSKKARKFTDNDSIAVFVNALKKAEAVNTLPTHENKTEYLLSFSFVDNTGKLIDIWLGKSGETSELTDVSEKGSNYILSSDSNESILKLINSK
jgi:hypothetical protein